jgi:hypothetical protein
VETPAVETKHPNQSEIETVLLVREALDDAWATLQPEERAETSRIFLAEGIRKAMANGERDPKRLREAALMEAAP